MATKSDKTTETAVSGTATASVAQAMPINPNLILILIILQFFFSGYLFFKINSTSAGVAPAAAAAPTADSGAAPEPAADVSKMPKVSDEDHIRGNANADVIMVEYSDFECPFCKTFKPTVDQALEEYGDKVALVYRHYPLSFHPKAQKTSEGAECAAELGGNDAFWQFHDIMFERMPDIELSAMSGIAGEIGLDPTAFQSCVDSGKYAKKIADQMTGGSAAGVQGTPGLVLVGKNGKTDFIGGAYPYADVKAKIDALLQ